MVITPSQQPWRPQAASRRDRNLDAASPRSASASFGDRLWSRLPVEPTTRLPMRAIGVTSSGPGEGVSTVAHGLAQAAAARGGPAAALLIDLSCWRANWVPAADSTVGLSDAVAGVVEADDAVLPSSHDGLVLLSAGRQKVDCCDLEQLQQLDKLLGDLRQQFGVLVIDLPCVADSDCASPLAALCDGVLVVVQADAVDAGKARQAVRSLQQAGARIAGAVLNKKQDRLPRWMRHRS